jgi:Na+/proline symporter
VVRLSTNAPSVDRRSGHEHARGFLQPPRWVWFNGAAFALGVLPVVLALTVHDRGTVADPDGVLHRYTLVHVAGPGVLGFVGAPAVITLVLPVLLYLKSTRRSHFADRAAWWLAGLSCLIGVVGLITAGLAMLPVTVLTVCAVATAPLAPELTRADHTPWFSSRAMAREEFRG